MTVAGVSCKRDIQYPFQDPMLDVKDRTWDLISRMTLDEKLEFLYVTQPELPRLGVAEYHYGNEALHGIVRRNGPATVFPQAIGLAATWDPELMKRCADAIGNEARAKHNENQGQMKGGEIWGGQFDGLLTFFSPTINMARDPRWGRTAETYGEDPCLTGEMAVAFIEGMQGDEPKYLKVLCTPKHFVANNEDANRFKANVLVSRKTLYEYYLPAFRKSIVEAKAGAIMSAYNAINGIPCTANKWLLDTLLRQEWGFEGYVVCDCGAIKHLYESHKYSANSYEAGIEAFRAGIDLECGGLRDLRNAVAKGLQENLFVEPDLDTALFNIFKGRFLLGMFDPEDQVPFNSIPASMVASQKHQDLALEAARKSIVLLKNDTLESGKPLLPVDISKNPNILVLGPNANICQFGERNYSGVPAIDPVSPLEGIIAEFSGECNINYIPWIDREFMESFVPVNKAFVPGVEEMGFKGTYIPGDQESSVPELIRTDPVIVFDWDNIPPDPFLNEGEFSIHWEGVLRDLPPGEYSFRIEYRGNVSLSINKSMEGIGKQDSGVSELEIPFFIDSVQDLPIEINFQGDNQNSPVCRFLWKYKPSKSIEVDDNRNIYSQADLIIAVLGLDSEKAVEGTDRDNLDLPQDQLDLIKEVYAANSNIIVVLINGNPLSVNWLDENIPAILEAWFPGESGGTAIAEVLSGKENPGGKLPLTFYRSVSQLPPIDSYEIQNGHTYMFLEAEPLYPFGFGLSYTRFRYDNLRLDPVGDSLNISLELINAGNHSGDDVVQLYFSKVEKNRDDPIRKLFDFRRVNLEAGQKKTLNFTIHPKEVFVEYDENQKGLAPIRGNILIEAGNSSAHLPLGEFFIQ